MNARTDYGESRSVKSVEIRDRLLPEVLAYVASEALSAEGAVQAALRMGAYAGLTEVGAWLYGREPDSVGGWTDLRYELGDGFRVDVNGPTISVGTRRLAMKFSRDEAMDLVRAVLSAVERLPEDGVTA